MKEALPLLPAPSPAPTPRPSRRAPLALLVLLPLALALSTLSPVSVFSDGPQRQISKKHGGQCPAQPEPRNIGRDWWPEKEDGYAARAVERLAGAVQIVSLPHCFVLGLGVMGRPGAREGRAGGGTGRGTTASVSTSTSCRVAMSFTQARDLQILRVGSLGSCAGSNRPARSQHLGLGLAPHRPRPRASALMLGVSENLHLKLEYVVPAAALERHEPLSFRRATASVVLRVCSSYTRSEERTW